VESSLSKEGGSQKLKEKGEKAASGKKERWERKTKVQSTCKKEGGFLD